MNIKKIYNFNDTKIVVNTNIPTVATRRNKILFCLQGDSPGGLEGSETLKYINKKSEEKGITTVMFDYPGIGENSDLEPVDMHRLSMLFSAVFYGTMEDYADEDTKPFLYASSLGTAIMMNSQLVSNQMKGIAIISGAYHIADSLDKMLGDYKVKAKRPEVSPEEYLLATGYDNSFITSCQHLNKDLILNLDNPWFLALHGSQDEVCHIDQAISVLDKLGTKFQLHLALGEKHYIKKRSKEKHLDLFFKRILDGATFSLY